MPTMGLRMLARVDAPSIRPMTASDWPRVRLIYEEGIATGVSTFETRAPTWDAWDAAHRPDCRLVAEREGQLVGWVALSPVSSRWVYRGVAELSIYVAAEARGQGVGRRLLESLIEASETSGIWTLQAGVDAKNAASIALHQRCAFRVVGRRERIGELRGEWRDVVLLERRSDRVGA
jgi:L-amino acid N-acyltransferase YncA